MRAGKARYRIELLRRDTSAQDSFGDDLRRFETLGVFFAQVEELQGNELSRAQVTWPKAKYQIIIRNFNQRIVETDVVVLLDGSNSYLNIVHVKRLVDKGRSNILICEHTNSVTVEPSVVISGVAN